MWKISAKWNILLLQDGNNLKIYKLSFQGDYGVKVTNGVYWKSTIINYELCIYS